MAKYKWLIAMPVLAFALVFGPTLLQSDKKPAENPRSAKSAIFRKSEKKEVPATSAIDPTSMALSLFGVLVLACGAIWLLKKIQLGNSTPGGREIQIKETHRLAPKRSIHLARVCDRLLLLADCEGGIQLLTDLTPKDEETVLDALLTQETASVTIPRPEAEGAVPRDFGSRVADQVETAPAPSPATLGNFRELLSKLGNA